MDLNMESCPVRRCPLCGQLIKDPDFENISEESCTEEAGGSGDFETIIRIFGKDGVEYFRHAALCLMTQNYPDSVHRKNFPNSILKPGGCYYHIVKYKFDLFEEVVIPSEEEEIINDSETEGEVEEEVEEKKDDDDDDLLEPKLEENGK